MKRHYEEEIRSLKEELRAQKNESFSDMLKKRWGMTEKEVVNG